MAQTNINIRMDEDLKKQGYEKVELIDTANGLFMQPIEAKLFLLSGSKLLVGKK